MQNFLCFLLSIADESATKYMHVFVPGLFG